MKKLYVFKIALLSCLISITSSNFFEIIGFPQMNQKIVPGATIDTKNIIFFLISSVIIAPILEEFFFRKIIFGLLYKKFSLITSALISALIFSLVHTHKLWSATIFGTGTFAIFLAFQYAKDKSLKMPIFLHSAKNILAWPVAFIIIEIPNNAFLSFVFLISFILFLKEIFILYNE